MTKFKVDCGDEFEVDSVSGEGLEQIKAISEASIAHRHVTMRERLVTFTMVAVAISLTTAVIIGAIDGTYNEVGVVWDAVALPLGYVLNTYFNKG